MEGKVKWFNSRKGYGFIAGDDGEEYFVHYTALAEGTFLRENDQVSFEPADGDKGKQAKDVKLLKKGSEMEGEEAPAEEEQTEEQPEEEAPEEEQPEEEADEEADEEEKQEE
ncbi:cold-shock protein [Nanoarchaeota archaeon]